VVHDLQVICGRVVCGGELCEKLTPLGLKQTDCWCNDVEHSQHVLHDLPFCCGHTSTHAFGGRFSFVLLFFARRNWSVDLCAPDFHFCYSLKKIMNIKTFSKLCKLSVCETTGAWRKLYNADL
jgi:hypothetical protein